MATLPSIANDGWQLLTNGLEQKANLLDYAKTCGVPVAPECWGHATDNDLYLSWLSDKIGIISMPKRIGGHRVTALISPADYVDLCQAYSPYQP